MYLNLSFLVPFISGIFMLITGSYVFLQNRNSLTHKYFLGLSISLGFWATLNAIIFGTANTSFFVTDLGILASIFIGPFMFLTLANFPSSADAIPRRMKIITSAVTIILVFLLIFFPRLFIIEIIKDANGVNFSTGFLYLIFFINLIAHGFLSLLFLYKTYKTSIGRIRAQTAAGIIGIAMIIIGSITTNTLFPYLGFGGSQTWFGPPFAFVALLIVVYMISEAKKKRVNLSPIIIVAIILIFFTAIQMFIASNNNIIILSGLVLIGIVLLMSFLIRDYLIENSDIKQLEELLRQVNKANNELKRQDEAKSEFISIASHHLRTPLTLVKWTLSELLNGSYGKFNKNQSKLLGNLNNRNEQFIKFIRNFLDFSRVEAGKINFKTELANIVILLKEIIERFSEFAKENNFEIYCVCDPNIMPDFYFDKESMRRVFDIIIENSVIYRRRGGSGKLDISVSSDGVNAIFVFKDNGLGIEKEHLDRIGEKFFRSDSVKEYVAEGTGLGVFIAKNLLSLHEGKLSIDSEAGKETTVTVKLPIRTAPWPQEEYLTTIS